MPKHTFKVEGRSIVTVHTNESTCQAEITSLWDEEEFAIRQQLRRCGASIRTDRKLGLLSRFVSMCGRWLTLRTVGKSHLATRQSECPGILRNSN